MLCTTHNPNANVMLTLHLKPYHTIPLYPTLGLIQTFLLNGPSTNPPGCAISFNKCW
jgi:hypothetical protein